MQKIIDLAGSLRFQQLLLLSVITGLEEYARTQDALSSVLKALYVLVVPSVTVGTIDRFAETKAAAIKAAAKVPSARRK